MFLVAETFLQRRIVEWFLCLYLLSKDSRMYELREDLFPSSEFVPSRPHHPGRCGKKLQIFLMQPDQTYQICKSPQVVNLKIAEALMR
nr:hypothetical protein CFP56_02353 [Quercus suber]